MGSRGKKPTPPRLVTHVVDTEPQATVKVRIPLVVDHTGRWAANGASEVEDAYMVRILRDCVESPQQLYFIEADVPIPDTPMPQTVRGTVLEW